MHPLVVAERLIAESRDSTLRSAWEFAQRESQASWDRVCCFVGSTLLSIGFRSGGGMVGSEPHCYVYRGSSTMGEIIVSIPIEYDPDAFAYLRDAVGLRAFTSPTDLWEAISYPRDASVATVPFVIVRGSDGAILRDADGNLPKLPLNALVSAEQ